jgi:hypothetical protein
MDILLAAIFAAVAVATAAGVYYIGWGAARLGVKTGTVRLHTALFLAVLVVAPAYFVVDGLRLAIADGDAIGLLDALIVVAAYVLLGWVLWQLGNRSQQRD